MTSVVKFKAIKPKPLKVDAVRLELLSMAHKTERDMKKDFQATTKTWKHKVTFTTMISLKGGVEVFVGTDDKIYGWVNDGTAEHDIKASKDKSLLVYQKGYNAKTTPGEIGSKKGGKFGGYVRKKSVHHPGFEGRFFDKAIAEKWKHMFKARAERALREGLRKTGHYIG